MSTTTPADRTLSPARSVPARAAPARLRPLDILILSAWCGLAGGLLEVGARVVGKTYFSLQPAVPDEPALRLAGPAVQPAALRGAGLRSWRWRRSSGRGSADGSGPGSSSSWRSCRCSIVLGPRIYQIAWVDPRAGGGRCAWPRSWSGTRPGCAAGCCSTFPGLLGVVLLLAGWRVGGQWLAERREAGRPLPARRSAERAPDHAGHRAGRPSEPLRLRPADVPGARAAGPVGHPLRRGAGGGPLDPPLAREPVHRPMAPRAERRLDDPARRHVPDPGRIPRARGAMRRRDSSPIPSSAPTTPAWTAASPITRITSSNTSLPFRTAWLVDHAVRARGRRRPVRRAASSMSAPSGPSTSPGSRPTSLAVADGRMPASINLRLPRLVVAAAPARAPVLRLPQLFRRPRPLRAARRGAGTASG